MLGGRPGGRRTACSQLAQHFPVCNSTYQSSKKAPLKANRCRAGSLRWPPMPDSPRCLAALRPERGMGSSARPTGKAAGFPVCIRPERRWSRGGGRRSLCRGSFGSSCLSVEANGLFWQIVFASAFGSQWWFKHSQVWRGTFMKYMLCAGIHSKTGQGMEHPSSPVFSPPDSS